jgi:hypothetical protein
MLADGFAIGTSTTRFIRGGRSRNRCERWSLCGGGGFGFVARFLLASRGEKKSRAQRNQEA